MLQGFRQRLDERRGKYSLLKHIGRLRREGRLPRVGLAAAAVLAVGGFAFARCEASSITGPSEQLAEAPRTTAISGGDVATATVGSETFRENTVERNVVFVGINPCNGDAVRAFGKRHDRFKAAVSPTSATLDHHINDSFRGEAINNPTQVYTGSDVHQDRAAIGVDGVEHRELTNEHLISQGPAPNWILHVQQRSDLRFTDPVNPVVTFSGHASCPPQSRCTREGGCPDAVMSVESVTP